MLPQQSVDSFLERLWLYVAPDKTLSMQARLYRWICLLIGVVCLGVVVPINALQHLPIWVNLACAALGGLALFCYRQSRRGRDYPVFLFITMLLMMSPVWFLNAGTQGSISFYFFSFMIYPMVLLRGSQRWILTGICIADLCVLVLLEYFNPSLSVPFHTPLDRVIDLTMGVACCGLAIALILWVVIANYDWEQALTSRYSKELSASLERLQVTQSSMDAAAEQILWIDSHGRIVYSNAAVTEALGYPPSKLATMKIHQLVADFPPADWAMRWERLKQARAVVKEWTQQRSDGSSLPAEVKLTYMNVGGNEYAVAFVRDVTERKQAEQRRLQMERQLQNMQRLESLGVLAGGVAHDFNNMLTAIMGNIMLAKEDVPSGSETKQLLTEAEHAAMQAQSLTGQLLAFSKGGKPIKSIVSVESVIRSSSSLVLRGSPAVCAIHIAPDIGSIEADPGQLGQVFNNLIINARDAMPSGGTVTITATRSTIEPGQGPPPPGNYIEIVVRDTGLGISAENLAKVFDPFFTTKKTGSGLGLAVVFAIVKNHKGHISVQSHPGVGTTFKILLPALAAHISPADQPATGTTTSTTSVTARRRRILVMDDEEMIRKPIVKLLAKLGCEVECASSGEETIQIYRQAFDRGTPFDVVLMDLTIPGGMGGKQTIEHLRAIDPAVKAVVSSGYSEDPVMSDYKAHGFVDVMVKPYTLDTLKEVIKRVFDNS